MEKPEFLAGWLEKKGNKGVVKTWRLRWFQQSGPLLFYFSDPSLSSDQSQALGRIDLAAVRSISSIAQPRAKSKVIAVTVESGRTFYVRDAQDNPQQYRAWLEGLETWKKYLDGGGSASPRSSGAAGDGGSGGVAGGVGASEEAAAGGEEERSNSNSRDSGAGGTAEAGRTRTMTSRARPQQQRGVAGFASRARTILQSGTRGLGTVLATATTKEEAMSQQSQMEGLERCGWLIKKGQKRWFALKEGQLTWYKEARRSAEAVRPDNALGSLQLSGCRVRKVQDKAAFVVLPIDGKPYELVSFSVADRDDWYSHLSKACSGERVAATAKKQRRRRAAADSKANLEGWLKKKGQGKKTAWRDRWFVQHDDKLLYYKSDAPGEQALGQINLSDIANVDVTFEDGINPTFDVHTSGRIWHLLALDEDDLQFWVDALAPYWKKRQSSMVKKARESRQLASGATAAAGGNSKNKKKTTKTGRKEQLSVQDALESSEEEEVVMDAKERRRAERRKKREQAAAAAAAADDDSGDGKEDVTRASAQKKRTAGGRRAANKKHESSKLPEPSEMSNAPEVADSEFEALMNELQDDDPFADIEAQVAQEEEEKEEAWSEEEAAAKSPRKDTQKLRIEELVRQAKSTLARSSAMDEAENAAPKKSPLQQRKAAAAREEEQRRKKKKSPRTKRHNSRDKKQKDAAPSNKTAKAKRKEKRVKQKKVVVKPKRRELQKTKVRRAKQDGPWEVGDRVMAQFDEDDLWYKAEIEKELEEQLYLVLFLGYGNKQECDESMIQGIPEDELSSGDDEWTEMEVTVSGGEEEEVELSQEEDDPWSEGEEDDALSGADSWGELSAEQSADAGAMSDPWSEEGAAEGERNNASADGFPSTDDSADEFSPVAKGKSKKAPRSSNRGAASRGRSESLLASEEGPNYDKCGIFEAASKGDLEALQDILDEREVYVDYRKRKEPRGWSALHFAVQSGQADAVELLLAHGADVNLRDGREKTTIHKACGENSKASLLRHLIEEGADVLASSDTGDTALHAAAQSLNLECARVLLESLSQKERVTLANAKGRDGQSPLHVAASNSAAVDFCQLLLDSGTDPDETDYHGDTPLHVAAKHACIRNVTCLLDDGAAADVENLKGHTPLAAALHERNDLLVELLLFLPDVPDSVVNKLVEEQLDAEFEEQMANLQGDDDDEDDADSDMDSDDSGYGRGREPQINAHRVNRYTSSLLRAFELSTWSVVKQILATYRLGEEYLKCSEYYYHATMCLNAALALCNKFYSLPSDELALRAAQAEEEESSEFSDMDSEERELLGSKKKKKAAGGLGGPNAEPRPSEDQIAELEVVLQDHVQELLRKTRYLRSKRGANYTAFSVPDAFEDFQQQHYSCSGQFALHNPSGAQADRLREEVDGCDSNGFPQSVPEKIKEIFKEEW